CGQGGNSGSAGLLRQLSGGQSQLRDHWRTGDGGAPESGDGSRAKHDRSLCGMARTKPRVRGRRCYLWQRRVPAVANGSRHHTLYAHAGQCSAQEQSALRSRAFHLPSRKQQLPLSRRPATQLRRTQCSEPNPRLHRDAQTLWRGGAQKAQCTTSPLKYLAIHVHEPARQRARDLANTPGFANAQRQRKKVEALFAELKNQIGLRRLRLRRMKFVREQFFLAATAQNIKRLVRFLR